MKTIGITGGTGTVGRELTNQLLARGYRVFIFSRVPGRYKADNNVSYHLLDAAQQQADIAALQQLDGMVHLAGEPVAARRWSVAQKNKIRASRVEGSAFIVDQLTRHATNCKVMVGASAIGYYGADKAGGKPFGESDPAANDFLALTCEQWEHEEHAVAKAMRLAIARIGIVLDKREGAYPQFAKPLSFGLMPLPGGGRQVVSWIHVADVAGIMLHLLENTQCSGPYNVVAPQPVSNARLMKAIGKAKKTRSIPAPVPGFVLKLVIGEMAVEVLKSTTVSAARIADSGYVFRYPDIDSAVTALESEA